MLLFRWILTLLLLIAGVCFVFYAGTRQPRYKRYGVLTLKWALIAACTFFGVLFLARLA